jgi:hypothetical protein
MIYRCSLVKYFTKCHQTILTSVCMIGERNEDLDRSEVSAFNGARGRFGVSWGPPCIVPTAAFRGRIPSFSFRLSGSRAVNDVKAIFYYSSSKTHWKSEIPNVLISSLPRMYIKCIKTFSIYKHTFHHCILPAPAKQEASIAVASSYQEFSADRNPHKSGGFKIR